ncbi:hypothetical protein CLU81_0604 [Flavobacterium sp. 9]|nr:hypothetical protein CLU81_0604 [Flavobacterium sp. 9]
MKKALLLFFALYTIIGFCQKKEFYLEGTLAKNKIYMKITTFDSSEPEATYFYQSSLKDIPLEGTRENDDFTFILKSGDSQMEKFVLKKIGKATFKGTWSNTQGKTFAVKLSPIDFSNYKSTLSENYLDEKLNLIRFKLFEFKKQKTTVYKNKKIVWYTEKHCNVRFFRLGDNFSEKSKNVVNPLLEKMQIENILDQFNCSFNLHNTLPGYIEYDTSITFLSNNLLGFKISSEWHCGGPYPDHGTEGYLIDLNTGKNYGIDNIIAFDKSVTTEKESNFDHFVKYKQTYFAPKLYAIINSEQHFKKPTPEWSCDMTNLDWWWSSGNWVYTEKGIEFTPSFPHAMKACAKPFLVPFQKLKKYKNSKFPYQF